MSSPPFLWSTRTQNDQGTFPNSDVIGVGRVSTKELNTTSEKNRVFKIISVKLIKFYKLLMVIGGPRCVRTVFNSPDKGSGWGSVR